MAEPTTAAAIGAIVVAKAAEEIGSRIGSEISDGIFGKSDNMADIMKMLNQMNVKIDEILEYARATYVLVEELPDVILQAIERERLYNAHNNIISNYETYIRLPEWHNTIGHSTMASLVASWRIIIDSESNIGYLLRLPRYGEFLLLVTNGQFYEAVISGIKSKIRLLENSLRVEREDILEPQLRELERLIKTTYVKSGTLLDSSPWVSWVMKDKRTITVRRCHDLPCRDCNGSITACWDEQVPDTAWNNQLDMVNRQIQNYSKTINSTIIRIRSIVLVLEILKEYLASLENRLTAIKSYSHVKVVESLIPFPEE